MDSLSELGFLVLTYRVLKDYALCSLLWYFRTCISHVGLGQSMVTDKSKKSET
jgi:hypothetical protein